MLTARDLSTSGRGSNTDHVFPCEILSSRRRRNYFDLDGDITRVLERLDGETVRPLILPGVLLF